MEPIMFHYFHDNNNYKKVDGSLSAEQLEEIITNDVYKVISADEWLARYDSGTLAENETCLTFDDGIAEQYDIAVPILDKHNIKGIFNICTFFFTGDEDRFEIQRHFRNNYFNNVNDFYREYFNNAKLLSEKEYEDVCQKVNFDEYLAHAKFYTKEDRKFRYFRDVAFKEKHFLIVDQMMRDLMIDKDSLSKKLWISQAQISTMSKKHLIGIHSHEHPTTIDLWSQQQQQQSYQRNKEILERMINQDITVCAYPCGKNNKETFAVMDRLKIKHAMIASTTTQLGKTPYLIPRIDSTDFYKLLESKK
ncbi:polysaccharide deacetylase [Sinobacterium caligoides]|uniref:Polysaccharide deacetylase n=1 Tax=Sinobacterium caligoides TaxID=933926 RepID=A0A3N2DPY2_9GAMM|nr:polysaccharide deacetylase family protein [Sinobacterium caligoides]ROS01843.1 polysaccharide deacetylase [Sinobacterium caligoides]